MVAVRNIPRYFIVYTLYKMNDITIMYKTYENDIEWLKYSLLSVRKYIKGYKNIVIYCHDKALEKLHTMLKDIDMSITVIPVTYDFHGYIKQMVVKCECYKDIHSKYIVIFDSDLLFTDYYDLNNLIGSNGKIQWLYSKKTATSVGPEWHVWKKSFEDMTKTPQDIHFMSNGFPFIFTRESLEKAAIAFQTLHNMSYSEFCISRLNNNNIKIHDKILDTFPILATIFEEFEWLGFYCKSSSLDYEFLNSNCSGREVHSKTKQYWSHGGLTLEIEREIKKTLEM